MKISWYWFGFYSHFKKGTLHVHMKNAGLNGLSAFHQQQKTNPWFSWGSDFNKRALRIVMGQEYSVFMLRYPKAFSICFFFW